MRRRLRSRAGRQHLRCRGSANAPAVQRRAMPQMGGRRLDAGKPFASFAKRFLRVLCYTPFARWCPTDRCVRCGRRRVRYGSAYLCNQCDWILIEMRFPFLSVSWVCGTHQGPFHQVGNHMQPKIISIFFAPSITISIFCFSSFCIPFQNQILFENDFIERCRFIGFCTVSRNLIWLFFSFCMHSQNSLQCVSLGIFGWQFKSMKIKCRNSLHLIRRPMAPPIEAEFFVRIHRIRYEFTLNFTAGDTYTRILKIKKLHMGLVKKIRLESALKFQCNRRMASRSFLPKTPRARIDIFLMAR